MTLHEFLTHMAPKAGLQLKEGPLSRFVEAENLQPSAVQSSLRKESNQDLVSFFVRTKAPHQQTRTS